jgi:hypothetical protein
MGDLATDLATDLASNAATDLAGITVPEQLGAAWWFDPASGITLNGSDVASHVDRIAGYTLTQGTAANQPAYEASGPSSTGVPAVNYTVASEFMTSTDAALLAILNSDGPFEVWTAARVANFNSNPIMVGGFDSSSATIRHEQQCAASGTRTISHDGATQGTALATGVSSEADLWYASSWRGLSERTIQRFGSAEGSNATTVTSISSIDRYEHGRRGDSSPSQYLEGRIYATIGFTRELTTDERTQMSEFLEALVGIA